MLPAQQGLDRADALGLEIELRLIFERELAAGDGAGEIALEALQLVEIVLDRGAEALAAAARGLGPVHREIGVLQQGLRALAVGREQRDPEARARLPDPGREPEGTIELARDLVGDQGRRLGVGQVREDQRELVAADPGHGVALAQGRAHPLADLLEHVVADPVAEGVVDLLELVEVDQDDREQAAVAPAARHRLAQAVLEQEPVGQAGQRVVLGEMQHAGFGPLAFGDVGRGADEAAARHRAALDVEDPLVGARLLEAGGRRPPAGQPQPLAGGGAGVAAARQIMAQKIAQGRAPTIQLGRIAVQLAMARVPGREPAVALEHGHALVDVLEGRLELAGLLAERGHQVLVLDREADRGDQRGVDRAAEHGHPGQVQDHERRHHQMRPIALDRQAGRVGHQRADRERDVGRHVAGQRGDRAADHAGHDERQKDLRRPHPGRVEQDPGQAPGGAGRGRAEGKAPGPGRRRGGIRLRPPEGQPGVQAQPQRQDHRQQPAAEHERRLVAGEHRCGAERDREIEADDDRQALEQPGEQQGVGAPDCDRGADLRLAIWLYDRHGRHDPGDSLAGLAARTNPIGGRTRASAPD